MLWVPIEEMDGIQLTPTTMKLDRREPGEPGGGLTCSGTEGVLRAEFDASYCITVLYWTYSGSHGLKQFREQLEPKIKRQQSQEEKNVQISCCCVKAGPGSRVTHVYVVGVFWLPTQ